jgi:outer membrane protein assembly factor BamB
VQYGGWSAPRPLHAVGLAYFVTGLSKGELLAVKTDGAGDVTDSGVVWRLRTRVGKYASPILADGLLYTAAAESFISCLEAATGQVIWTERVGGKFAASPIYADGRLYFCSQEGNTLVLKPGRSLEVLATNTLSTASCSPAASAGVFPGTKTQLYRIEEPIQRSVR